MKRKYIIRAIDYVNSAPHIGHALEFINSDVLKRYFTVQGYDVRLGVGTDEHGQKIANTAKENNLTPQEHCDKYAKTFENLANELGIDYDTFIRTTDEKHKKVAQKYWQKVMKKGDIYKKKYTGKYCVGCETFKQERDLIDGKCPNHPNKELETIEEENYFFKLSNYTEPIYKWLLSNKKVIFPETRYNEILQIVKDGLLDISVSRSKKVLSWGVPVPGDDSQVMYVWFDALLNYFSSIEYGENTETFDNWWNNSEILHILGKDIIRHHVAIWPGMLLSLGHKLPDNYFIHGFVTSGGVKMGKSIGNVIDPVELLEKYGEDSLRWFLSKEMIAGKDGDITPERFHEVYNNDLANNLGNLFRRVLVLINKYKLEKISGNDFEKLLIEKDIEFVKAMDGYKINQGCEIIYSILQEGNKYIDQKAPWKVVKENPDDAAVALWSLYNLLKWVSNKLIIFLPSTAKKMEDQLKTLEVGDVLFPRIDINDEENK